VVAAGSYAGNFITLFASETLKLDMGDMGHVSAWTASVKSYPKAMYPSMRKPTSSRNRCKPGMTLIEILVVIAIIGTLAALVFPSLKKSINSANRVKCLGNLKQIGIAAEQYTQDYNNTFSPVDYWPDWLSLYIFNTNKFRFPSHTKTVFWCPSAVPTDLGSAWNGNVAYAINAQGYAGLRRFQETSVNNLQTVPSKRIAFMDGNSGNMWDTTPERVPAWHGDCYNAIFQDSHAESVLTNQFPPGGTAWRNLLWGYKRY